MSCLTTLKLTSASSNATRTSRSADSIFSADRRPSPRMFLKTRCNLSERLSNIRQSLGLPWRWVCPGDPALGHGKPLRETFHCTKRVSVHRLRVYPRPLRYDTSMAFTIDE